MTSDVFDGDHDWDRVVLTDRIIAKRPHEWIGPSALLGHFTPAVLNLSTITIASDASTLARRCADLFSRAAIHGGFATASGFTWNKITSIAVGATSLEALLARLGDSAGAYFTESYDGIVTLRLFLPDGSLVVEDNGLRGLRTRLKAGRAAHPVNATSIGILIDQRDRTTSAALDERT